MTDTSPAALRALADDLQHGPVIDGVRVRSRLLLAAATLRAVADEKEAALLGAIRVWSLDRHEEYKDIVVTRDKEGRLWARSVVEYEEGYVET
jgi:hypothetical protein